MASLTPRLDKLDAGRNLVQNGNFDIWQRNTSFSISGASYNFRTADRWTLGKDTTPSTVVASQSTDVPTLAESGFQSRYSLLVTNNAVGNSPASNDGLFINYRMEGQDYAAIHGQKVRLQFWVKSTVVGTYSLLLINKVTGGNMRYYATTYTVNVANTWEKKSIDVILDNTGVWNLDNTIGLNIHWTLSCGAGTQTPTLNTWTTSVAQFEGSTGQVNWTGTNSATFRLAQVQLTAGDYDIAADLPFSRAGKNIAEEFAMCQRYYEKSYNLAEAPGTNTNNGRCSIVDSAQSATNTQGCYILFKVRKRSDPTMTIYTTGGTSGSLSFFSGTSQTSTAGTFSANEAGSGVFASAASGLTIRDAIQLTFQWVAEAEL